MGDYVYVGAWFNNVGRIEEVLAKQYLVSPLVVNLSGQLTWGKSIYVDKTSVEVGKLKHEGIEAGDTLRALDLENWVACKVYAVGSSRVLCQYRAASGFAWFKREKLDTPVSCESKGFKAGEIYDTSPATRTFGGNSWKGKLLNCNQNHAQIRWVKIGSSEEAAINPTIWIAWKDLISARQP